MGLCLDEIGIFSIELRRESFIIHFEDQEDCPHPEFYYEDMDDLINALNESRQHCHKKNIETKSNFHKCDFSI